MSQSTITCPNCGTQFEPTDAFKDEVQKELNAKAKEWQAKKEEDFRKKEELLLKEKEDALLKQKQNLEENIRKTISSDFENKMKMMDEANKENEVKLKAARDKELEFMRKEKAFKEKEEEMEIVLQKKLQEERLALQEQIRKQEQEKTALKDNEHQMQLNELKKQLEDQKKLAEEMKRKAEQGSMQLQGEVLELALEELLRGSFPFDTITEVGKGVRGADAIQTVRNKQGQDCGKIIYESKRTKAFSNDWIEKLKADMRSQQADVAVLVTEVLPKDMESFGEKDGIFICRFSEVKALSHVLRDSIIKMYAATRSQENKGDKMSMLYNYLTSNEFSEQWSAIREGFMSMKLSIQKERDAMEKLWKSREKQLEKVLLNAAHVKGSVEGIAGQDSVNLSLGEADDLLLE
ncbi:MAG: hypothetical protein K0S33_1075 [Bacteroidetes bacterium]|jgi:hypothetical protein|nr:hypothetical protein [Bacteroidota bacterium]